MRHLLVGVACMALLLPLASAAHAEFIGATFTADYFVPTTTTPYDQGSFDPSSFTVGAGMETTGDIEGVTQLFTDFGATDLVIEFSTTLSNPTITAQPFSGPIFTSLAPLGITSFSLGAANDLAGFTADRVFFTDTQIGLNLQGLSYQTGSTIALDFTFAPGAVPEVGTWAAMIVGFGMTGAALRRRRARTAIA